MDVEGFLDRPVATVEIKPWHILALLGGGVAAYFLLKPKAPAQAPAQAAPQNPQSKSPAPTGLSYAFLGEQTEPLYETTPLVQKARQYTNKGWTIFKVPTGVENVMQNRQRFEVHKVYAAPPGQSIPKHASPVKI